MLLKIHCCLLQMRKPHVICTEDTSDICSQHIYIYTYIHADSRYDVKRACVARRIHSERLKMITLARKQN